MVAFVQHNGADARVFQFLHSLPGLLGQQVVGVQFLQPASRGLALQVSDDAAELLLAAGCGRPRPGSRLAEDCGRIVCRSRGSLLRPPALGEATQEVVGVIGPASRKHLMVCQARSRANAIRRSSTRSPPARRPLCSYSLVSQILMPLVRAAVSSEKTRGMYMSLT
jgi:hypothetical protein